jgi:hypothetical protein
MADAPSRRFPGARWLILFLVAYGADFGLRSALDALRSHIYVSEWGVGHPQMRDFLLMALSQLGTASWVGLRVASIAALVATLVRIVRRRPRAAAPPSLFTRLVLPWIPGVLWLVAGALDRSSFVSLLGHVAASAVIAPVFALAVRFGVNRLRESDAVEAPPAGADSSAEPGVLATFAAVAVTPAARGAVGALAAMSLAMAVYAATAPVTGTLGGVMTLAYAMAALGGTMLFRSVSRIVVGIDGVLVIGAERKRFIGYGAIDEVRESRGDLLLLRGGRLVLRLQLQEADAARSDVLVARLREAMARAAILRSDGAEMLVRATMAGEGASRRLLSSIRGGLDYRQPALAREQLWKLVEGPAAERDARTLAAGALVPTLDEHERTRLRAAADNCADPRVRVALRAFADGHRDGGGEQEEDERDDLPPGAMRTLRA